MKRWSRAARDPPSIPTSMPHFGETSLIWPGTVKIEVQIVVLRKLLIKTDTISKENYYKNSLVTIPIYKEEKWVERSRVSLQTSATKSGDHDIQWRAWNQLANLW